MEQFGQNFKMKIKEDRNEQNSWMGVCFTILLNLIMGIFWFQKLTVLIEKKDVDVTSVLVESYLDQTYKFDTEQGFFLAAAITEYDSNTEIIEEPEVYGELIFEHYGWGYEDGFYGSKPLVNHQCSREELGFEKSQNP